MSGPEIGRRRRFAPPVSAKVNWSHPLNNGLLAYHLPSPSGAVDLTGGPLLPRAGNPVSRPTAMGRGLASPANGDVNALITGTAGRFSIQPPLTLMTVVQWTGTLVEYHDFYGVAYSNNDTDPYQSYQLAFNGGNNQLTLWGNSAGTFYDTINATQPAIGTHVLIGTQTPTASNLYIDGALVASGAGVSTINYSSTATMGFGYAGPSARVGLAAFAAGAVWRRELSVNEAVRLSADPFQGLRY